MAKHQKNHDHQFLWGLGTGIGASALLMMAAFVYATNGYPAGFPGNQRFQKNLPTLRGATPQAAVPVNEPQGTEITPAAALDRLQLSGKAYLVAAAAKSPSGKLLARMLVPDTDVNESFLLNPNHVEPILFPLNKASEEATTPLNSIPAQPTLTVWDQSGQRLIMSASNSFEGITNALVWADLVGWKDETSLIFSSSQCQTLPDCDVSSYVYDTQEKKITAVLTSSTQTFTTPDQAQVTTTFTQTNQPNAFVFIQRNKGDSEVYRVPKEMIAKQMKINDFAKISSNEPVFTLNTTNISFFDISDSGVIDQAQVGIGFQANGKNFIARWDDGVTEVK